jgi:hypothetical protein
MTVVEVAANDSGLRCGCLRCGEADLYPHHQPVVPAKAGTHADLNDAAFPIPPLGNKWYRFPLSRERRWYMRQIIKLELA